jgi:hypothetical protein
MKYRKLRIAWSVVWGVVAVLLVVLWVRSYWKLDGISGNRGIHYVYLDTFQGDFHFARIVPSFTAAVPWRAFHNAIVDTDLQARDDSQKGVRRVLGVGWKVFGNGWQVSVALWLPALISGVFAVAPWTRQLCWRFSIRTLLIATTLVAVVLGLIAYAARK